MITLKAYRYDGSSSLRTPVQLFFTEAGVQVHSADLSIQYPYHDVILQPRLAGAFSQLRFADGSQCDIETQPDLDAALAMIPGHAGNRRNGAKESDAHGRIGHHDD